MRNARTLLLLAPFVLGSCATISPQSDGPLQPQSEAGPCQVKKFFFLGQRSVPTDLVIRNTGEACRFTLVNYAAQIPLTAALVTTPAQHGRATAELISGNFQGMVTYVAQPGYAGPDRFSVTLEPGAVGVTVNVSVVPGR